MAGIGLEVMGLFAAVSIAVPVAAVATAVITGFVGLMSMQELEH